MTVRRVSLVLCLFFSSIFTVSVMAESQQHHLVVAFGSTDIVWNPHHSTSATEAQIYTAVYEGLVTYHPITLEPVPGVAESWEVSEDRLTYTFHLRPDARYWNGDRVIAAHFRDAWLKFIRPEEGADYSFLLDIVKNARTYRNGGLDDPEQIGIKALSDTVLEVTLDSPAGHFLKVLAHHSFAPVHPDFLALDDWTQSPSIISNGPFTIVEKTEEAIEMVKNDLYWDADKVSTERLSIILSSDHEDLTRRFNNKEIHWTTNFQYSLLEDPEKTFILNPQFATSYFFFNCRSTPWNDSKVRTALNLLVDWSSVRNEERMYLPSSTVIPDISGYPEVKGVETRDKEKALELLSEAGYPKGKGLADPVILILPVEEHRGFAQAMKSAWEEELGITVSVREIPFREYYNAIEGDDYTLGLMSWIGDYPDPLTFLQMWVSDSNLNKGRYVNPEYDRIIGQAIAAQGLERYTLLAEAETLILSESAIIPYKHEPALNAVHIDTLQYWMFNPLDIHPFKYMRYYLPPLIPNTVRLPGDVSPGESGRTMNPVPVWLPRPAR
ncbi:MAG: peptide ABC transporter substrate-binding protein [Spirochaetales bacterium]|nr:peptide ABC transporter substrate-binding protein [Spirochaetales bacterium]